MTTERLYAYIYLLIASLIWGVAGPVIKHTLGELPPALFLTYRFAISSVVAVVALALRPPAMPRTPGGNAVILLYSFLISTVSLGFLFLGFDKTTVISGTLITALSPMLVAIAGAVFLKEQVTGRERLGIGIASAGTLFTIFEPVILNHREVAGQLFEGNLYMVLSLMTGVVTAIMAKVLLRKTIDPASLTHISFIVGFITIVPFLFATMNTADIVQALQQASPGAHLGVWYMALLSGTVAYTLSHMGQKLIEASEAGLFTYLLPVWAIPISIFWLGETVDIPTLIGAGTIGAGVLLAEYRKQARKRPAHHGLSRPRRRS